MCSHRGDSSEREQSAMKLKKCPECGSANIRARLKVQSHETLYDICVDCCAVWESIPASEHFKRDGELIAFKQPCDNCAFRSGSPESQDKEAWRNLLEQLRAGGSFFCHKGVPIKTLGKGHGADFKFPLRPDGMPDKDQMRLCRGFLKAWAVWMAQADRGEAKQNSTHG
jgi:hypothetical protein